MGYGVRTNASVAQFENDRCRVIQIVDAFAGSLVNDVTIHDLADFYSFGLLRVLSHSLAPGRPGRLLAQARTAFIAPSNHCDSILHVYGASACRAISRNGTTA